MTKIGLVLEGGGMRGLYSEGVIDTFLEESIEFDGIIGVSAGALFGANFFSNQKGRALRYNKKYCNDKRYISIRNLIKTGNIVDKEFAYYKITNELDRFDDETFKKQNKDFYAVITNVESGLAEYKNLKDGIIKNMEVLRATSAMPMVSKIVEIDNNKYLDGAITDSIPYQQFLNLGYDKIVVVLTQHLEYRKKPYNKLAKCYIKLKYKKYPKLINLILNRYQNYNSELEKIIDLENKKEIFVIRPSEPLNIKRLEKDPAKLQAVYDLGLKDGKKNIKKLKEYLKK